MLQGLGPQKDSEAKRGKGRDTDGEEDKKDISSERSSEDEGGSGLSGLEGDKEDDGAGLEPLFGDSDMVEDGDSEGHED